MLSRRKSINPLERRSLFALSLLFPFLIIFGVACIVGYSSYMKSMDAANRSNGIRATLLARLILEQQKAALGVLQSYAKRALLIDAVKRKDFEAALGHLVDLAKNNPEVEWPYITNPDSTVWVNFPVDKRVFNKDLSERDWYKGVSKEWKPYISSVYKMVVGEKDLAVTISVPVFDEKGKVIGILGGAQSAALFRNAIDEVVLSSEAHVTLIDQEGHIIHSNRLAYTKEVIGYPSFDFVRRAMKGEKGAVEIQDASDGNKVKYVSFAPIQGIGWLIIVEKAKSEVLKAEYSTFALIAVISLLIYAVVALFLFYFRARHKQIRSLEKVNEELDGRVRERTAELESTNQDLKSEIIERKRAEEALREGEERLAFALETSHTGAWDLDLEGHTAHRSLEHDRIFGYGQLLPQWTYEMFLDHVLPEDRGAVDAKFRQAVESHGDWSFECRIRRLDGEIRWIWAAGRHRQEAAGRVQHMAGIVQDITERRLAEEALRKERDFSGALVDTAGALVVVLDKDGRIRRFNRACEALTRYTAAEVMGRVFWEILIPPEELQGVMQTWKALRAGHFLNQHENHWVPKEGPPRLIAWSNTALVGPHGEIEHIIATGLDITDWKQAEQELFELNQRLQALMQAVPVGVSFSDDPTCQRITGNPAVLAQFEVTPGDNLSASAPDDSALGRLVRFFQNGREVSDTGLPLQRAVAENRVIPPMELEVRLPSGRRWFTEASGAPVRDAKGKVIGGLAVTVDITERRRMEEELRKSRDELELRVQERTAEICRQAELIDLAHDAIIVTAINGVITSWNEGATEIYGFGKEEALGKMIRDLLETKFPVSRDKIVTEVLQRERWEGELTQTRKDGKEINVLSRWALQKDEEGRPIGIMVINHDITQRLKLEEQLRQAQKLEAIGTLTGGIAHDFNNILGAVVINSEMALLDLPGGSGLRTYLELILKAGIRGRDLVTQMLLFSRKSEKRQEVLTLTPLIKDTFKLLRSSLPTTIQMKLLLETESDSVSADPSQIQQVIMNLCTNAAYAMRGTTGSIDISLQSITFGSTDLPEADMQPGEYVVLSVKDTGSGMDEEVKKRIFEPFFTTKPVGEGTGLGLSVVYGIVKNHKGNITVYSEPGKGSIFKVYLPKVDTSISTVPEAPKPIPRGKERILLVDDEDFNIKTVRNMLQHLGYKVTALMDSRDALKLFSADPSQFDLVITDQTMPFMTGEDLGKELMRMRSDIAVILCTGYSDLISSEKATALGFRGYIMKPFTVREGAELVRRVLDQKGTE